MIYIRKKYLDRIKPFIWKDIIKILIWQRRVGKSTLLHMVKNFLIKNWIREEKILFVDMEDLENEKFKDYKIFYNYAKNYDYIFVDEVQNINNWEKAILSLQNKWKDVYISWSNSKILSSELATNLRWRYIQFVIYPFDYKEFLEAFNFSNSKGTFLKYIKFWSLPYLLKLDLKEDVVYEYLNSLYSTIILKDIVERNKLRNLIILEKLIWYLAKNIWNIFSGTNIANYLKNQKINISTITVLQYLQYLKQAFLINEIKRYDLKWKKIFEIKEKYYFTDIGLRNAILGWFSGIDIAGILENVVAVNFLSNWWNLYVWEYRDFEVDFVAEKWWRKIYIQVSYLIADEKVKEREFGNLQKIKDNRPKYVVSMDDIAQWEYEGIKWMKIWEFLEEINKLN